VAGLVGIRNLTPQQLFAWRREARKRLEAETPPTFVPAVVVAPKPMATKEPKPQVKRRALRRRIAAIELEGSGVTMRIGDGRPSPHSQKPGNSTVPIRRHTSSTSSPASSPATRKTRSMISCPGPMPPPHSRPWPENSGYLDSWVKRR
jgi:transposase